jgi:hypothetical protein
VTELGTPVPIRRVPRWGFHHHNELLHGRIAMLATLGWIVADFVKLPGDVHAVSSLEAHNAAVSSGALIQVLLWSVRKPF